MSEQSTPTAETTPRFDAFFTAVEKRLDNWQCLHGLAQAWAGLPGAGGRRKVVDESRQFFSELEVLENYYAFPGPAGVQRLRERLRTGDAGGFMDLTRRIAKAVLGGTYRRDASVWDFADAEPGEP